MRALGVGMALAALMVGPWLAVANGDRGEPAAELIDPVFSLDFGGAAPQAAPAACGCKRVELDLENIVTRAELETGDARTTNRFVAYLAQGYVADGVIELTVEQIARAFSGDAIAGQVSAVLAEAEEGGCTDVVVRARNFVQDAELKTGDARAENFGTVLLDPGVNTELVKVDWRQVAVARTGDAIAGQVISVLNRSLGPCGTVTLDLESIVGNVDIETGEARAENHQAVTVCRYTGCARELLKATRKMDAIRMCLPGGCATFAVEELRPKWKAEWQAQRLTELGERDGSSATPQPEPARTAAPATPPSGSPAPPP